MRAPCNRCGEQAGTVTRKGMQDVVRCSNCDRHCYNAPRTELGLKPVTLASRPDIKPSRRFRILDAHGHACVSCHRTDVDLQIDHLISREAADRLGFLDELKAAGKTLVIATHDQSLADSLADYFVYMGGEHEYTDKPHVHINE